MANIGLRNQLKIQRETPNGLYLDGDEQGEILLPRRYVQPGMVLGETVDVFVYFDSEDRYVATTEHPKVMVGQFACLRVVQVVPGLGAFLDWGLSRDLLLPERELDYDVRPEDWLVIFCYVDRQNGRLAATLRVEPELNLTLPTYERGAKVKLLIFEETPMGYNAIVNHAHQGLLYRNEVYAALYYGQEIEGYIRQVRPDGKIDLRLEPEGYERVAPLVEAIAAKLAEAGGRLPLDDESSPEEIRDAFSTSKKVFKQALGALYRARRIEFTRPGIRAIQSSENHPVGRSFPKAPGGSRQR